MRKGFRWPDGVKFLLLAALLFFCLWQPFDPYQVDAAASLQAPSASHWFGTDWLGRDLYSRTGLALQLSLLRAGAAEILSFLASFLLSVLFVVFAARGQNAASFIRLVIRLLPPLLFLFAIASWSRENFAGPMLGLFALSFCFTWPVFSAEIEQSFRHPCLVGARALGASPVYMAQKVMAPAALPKLLRYARLDFASLIAYEAFLGMGGVLRPPQPALGALIFDGRNAIVSQQLWLFLFPTVALAMTIVLLSVGRAARNKD